VSTRIAEDVEAKTLTSNGFHIGDSVSVRGDSPAYQFYKDAGPGIIEGFLERGIATVKFKDGTEADFRTGEVSDSSIKTKPCDGTADIELYEPNADRRPANNSQSIGEVKRLRQEVSNKNQEISQLKSVIDRINNESCPIATVLKVHNEQLIIPMPSDFQKQGRKVSVRPESPLFTDDKHKLGTALNISGAGWVIVKFADGTSKEFRTGEICNDTRGGITCDGTCDLLFVSAPKVSIIVNNSIILVDRPQEFEVIPGMFVVVNYKTQQIISEAPIEPGGEIVPAARIIDDKNAEVNCQGRPKVIDISALPTPPKRGDRLVVDPGGNVAIRNLGKDNEAFRLEEVADVSWDDIGGLVSPKREMRKLFEEPANNAAIYAFYGQKIPKGVLLYGPPGCGKTMLGKALAKSLANIRGDGAARNGAMLYVKGPEILTKWVGESEATIRQIFESAREFMERNGYPCVIFIDEADAILNKRGSGRSSDVERTIVPAFLAEMDGMEKTGAIVILATNRPDILDPAATRDGRIDRKIKITRPDLNAAKDIFEITLKDCPIANGLTTEQFAQKAIDELWSDHYVLYTLTTRSNETHHFCLRHIVSGAMIVNIVQQAKSKAISRDIEDKTQTGICEEDVISSIADTHAQNLDLNMQDALDEYIHDYSLDITSCDKAIVLLQAR